MKVVIVYEGIDLFLFISVDDYISITEKWVWVVLNKNLNYHLTHKIQVSITATGTRWQQNLRSYLYYHTFKHMLIYNKEINPTQTTGFKCYIGTVFHISISCLSCPGYNHSFTDIMNTNYLFIFFKCRNLLNT